MEIAILIVSLLCLCGIGAILWAVLIILGAATKFLGGMGNINALMGKGKGK